MKASKFQWIALVLGVVISLSIPASIILKNNAILQTGEVAKFKLQPIDPRDPFRGRYVQLSFEENVAPIVGDSVDFDSYPRGFLSFDLDEDGFVVAKALHRGPPEGEHYVAVEFIHKSWVNESDNEYRYQFPFDRYYLNEKDAPRAERIARQSIRRNIAEEGDAGEESYLVVRILNGEVAIEALYIGGKTVEERLLEE